MINANELRIGNWVTLYNTGEKERPVKVDLELMSEIFNNEHYNGSPKIKPIPLTPEILERAGFTIRTWGKPDAWDKYGSSYAIGHYDTNYVLHRSWEKEPDWCMGLEPTDCEGQECQYKSEHFCWGINHLHQLQNLYFALTGEELEINLSLIHTP